MTAPQIPSSLGEFVAKLESLKGKELSDYLISKGFVVEPLTKTWHKPKEVYAQFKSTEVTSK